ncbi:MAG: PD-(D/E)XK nuclease family protein [Actinomyces sp.]|uniref:PD-(D/E)XK nuclease family protein n=1 Tax=Actinomyces sp. TaxID=29317 RepID=UPI0026DC3071|nr:PD-(D/E)XK nuclease family protein [Actinomyces sp.]MDO4244090.1 PD-(D/E)XK nuclease family protein [Actinomyces sp.]
MDKDSAPLAPRLLPALPHAPLPEPDAAAHAVLERSGSGSNLVVLGAPGTGKTSLALRLLTEAVAAGREALLLAPTRTRADSARQRSAHLLREAGAGGGAPRVRTPAGFAFTILSTSLTRRPDPLPAPVLLAGAEEDAALATLIRPEQWPGLPPEAVTSRAFRTELRNLLARAGELDVDAQTLAELGRALNVPVWGPASALLNLWDAQGRPTAGTRSLTRRLDTARIQDRAVEALATWEEDAVAEPRPVPDLLIVDDYQDCTAATARLLTALATPDAAGHRAQVIVLGDPDVAVETFRGGAPSLLVEAEDSSGLAAQRLALTTRHRGSPALAAVWADQARRLPVTGTASHRHPAPPPPPSSPAPSGVQPVIASSPTQEAAHVARALRAEHIHHATPWDQMAVIVRSTGHLQRASRELRRRGVPLGTSTPAVLLRAEPAAAALLDTVRAALQGRLGQAGRPPERAAALALLTSPLIGLSTLDLRRLRRRLRAEHPTTPTPDHHLLETLATPRAAQDLADRLGGQTLAEHTDALPRAATIIDAVRSALGAPAITHEQPPTPHADDHQPGHGEPGDAKPDAANSDGQAPADIEALLWAAWDASGCATRWRALALGGLTGEHLDPLLAEAAERDLDVVTTLFKRAEVWAERNPGAPATAFLTELAEEVLPSDSVAPQGQRPPGVAVLTPAAAAGGQWEVVAVMGLNRDSWPDLRLRDSITRSGLLVEAVMDRLPADGAGLRTALTDPAAARAQVRADERRMLLAALSRASRRLIVTAAADEDTAPSAFLTEIAQAAGTPITDSDGAPLTAPDVGDLTLRGLVGELRHAAVAGHLPGATDAERHRAQQAAQVLARLAEAAVPGAHPRDWQGLGGPTSTAPLADPGGPVRVSPSDVEALTTCPLRWFLRRQGGDRGPTPAQGLGILIHTLAEKAQREGLRGHDLMNRLEQRLPELGYPDTWLGRQHADRARDMVRRLDAYLSSVPGAVDVEQPIDALLDLPRPEATEPAAPQNEPGARVTVQVHGRIDRVEHLEAPGAQGPGRVRVIDLKTGSQKPADPTHHPQLATYRLALEAQGREVAGAGLVLLGKNPTRTDPGAALVPPGAALAASPDPDTGQDWAAELLATAALHASGPTLQARTGAHCARCEVKDSCPAVPEGRSAHR